MASLGSIQISDLGFKVMLVVLMIPMLALAADDYEALLNAEVDKVEARQIDGASVSSAVGDKLPRAEFDAMLKSGHKGIFTFYKHLPERSRQEIYAEYVSGASIPELRVKTLARFKQR